VQFQDQVTDHEVCSFWRILQDCPAHRELRGDILNDSYPSQTPWYKATIEDSDIPKLCMLPVVDFDALSKNTWKLVPAVEYYREHFAAGTYVPEYNYHAPRMQKLLDYGGSLETRLIVVADNNGGPFTILDGNHRAVLLLDQGRLIGTDIYCGVHSDIRKYSWMQKAYENWKPTGQQSG
jgi:hypothetical protein